MRRVLAIAGSDSSGGAGIQADIKTIAAHGVFAETAITALTAQNTTGVFGVMNVPPEFVAKQLDCVFEDIYPDAVKIGMVSTAGIIEAIAERLSFHKAKHIVLDTVMVSTSGCALIDDSACDALITRLIPLALLITPNIPEAERLCGMKISSQGDMSAAARRINAECGCVVLVKGGHSDGFGDCSDDLLFDGSTERWFKAPRIANPNTHGTGCTLSSAIAARLALGDGCEQAVAAAKEYITGAIAAQLDLGRGSGPINHMWRFYGGGDE